eukprot:7367442-Heterocapsa_arctica.AAC.1
MSCVCPYRVSTPLGLGEILRTRAYAANGQVDTMAARKQDAALGFKRSNGSTTDFELVEQER